MELLLWGPWIRDVGEGGQVRVRPTPGAESTGLATANAPEGEKDGRLVTSTSAKGPSCAFSQGGTGWLQISWRPRRGRDPAHGVYDWEPLGELWGGAEDAAGRRRPPMTPNLGQGACQAIEDAVVLHAAWTEEVLEEEPAPLRVPATFR